MEHILLVPIIKAFYALLDTRIMPYLHYETMRDYTHEKVMFRQIDVIDTIKDSDVICVREIDTLLDICLVSDGSVLVNGNMPLGNLSEMLDFMPWVGEGGFIGSAIIYESDSYYEYIYRIAKEDLSRPQVIESLNTYLANPESGWSLPYIQKADAEQMGIPFAA